MILLALLIVDLISPARELARKIVATAGSRDVSIAVKNLSSLNPAEIAEVRKTLEAELNTRRSAAADAQVTLSENLQNLVFTAEVTKAEVKNAEVKTGVQRDVVIVSVRRPSPELQSTASPETIAIERRLVWEQERPILDVAQIDDTLLVLEPDRLAVYRDRLQQAAVALPLDRARDPRGRLLIDRDTVAVHFFGQTCRIRRPIVQGSMCVEDGVAPVLTGGPNFFTSPAMPPHFSAAEVDEESQRVTISSGVDGVTRVTSGPGSVSIPNSWGSDLAAIDSACGRLVLATSASDPNERDSLQAHRFVGGRAVAAGAAVDFPGPVTALWSSGQTALAVSKHAVSERYAAYSLSISCGR